MKTGLFVALFTVVGCKVPETWGWDDQGQRSTSESKYCCSPPKWEGLQSGIGGFMVSGRPQTYSFESRVAFDRSAMKWYYFINTTLNGNVYSIKYIQDYKSGYQWVIDVRTQQCNKTKLTQTFSHADTCVADSARYNGNFAIGLGSESFMGKSFSFNGNAPGAQWNTALTVTAGQCYPVTMMTVGSFNNLLTTLDMGYMGLTAGIKDPSIFNPPAVCQHTTNNSDIFAPHMEDLHQILNF